MPRTLRVNLSDLSWHYFRFLYPKIEKDSMAPVVYLTDIRAGEGYDLELVQDKSGFPVYQKEGVIALLKELDYFQASKIARLESESLVDLDQVYRAVAMLRVANKIPKESGDSVEYILEFFKKSLDDRIQYVSEKGSPALLSGILAVLVKALDKGALKAQNKFYVQHLAEFLSRFKRRLFKENFELTDNWKEDLLHIQFYIGE